MTKRGAGVVVTATAVLSLLSGCDGGTTDVPDAAVPMDAPSTGDGGGIDAPGSRDDAFVAPTDDAFVAPTDDAFVAPTDDAFVASMPDAFVPADDAFVAPMPDAFVSADAFVTPMPDAFVPSDAFVPTAPQFCDVVYAVGGGTCARPARSGRFHTIKTGLGATNQYFDVGTNCTTPRRGTRSGTAVATPFTPADFPRGFIRLRFPATGGAPTAGTVQVVEYYMPIEFSLTASGTTVVTDVDHSAGMLRYAATGCAAGVSGCIAGTSDTMAPTLSRSCSAVAQGTLAGTTLAWDTCPVRTPSACVGTSCTPSMAQLQWTPAMSQDSMASAGCLTNVNTWGGVHCTMGLGCGLVPGTGAPTNATWDQTLPSVTFSSTSYGAMGTTITLNEMIIPDDPNDVYTGTQVVTATAVHVECGAIAALTCDEE